MVLSQTSHTLYRVLRETTMRMRKKCRPFCMLAMRMIPWTMTIRLRRLGCARVNTFTYVFTSCRRYRRTDSKKST